jgi:hypothetical protein
MRRLGRPGLRRFRTPTRAANNPPGSLVRNGVAEAYELEYEFGLVEARGNWLADGTGPTASRCGSTSRPGDGDRITQRSPPEADRKAADPGSGELAARLRSAPLAWRRVDALLFFKYWWTSI